MPGTDPRYTRRIKRGHKTAFIGEAEVDPLSTLLAARNAWRREYLGVGRNGPARSLPAAEIKRRQALEDAARK